LTAHLGGIVDSDKVAWADALASFSSKTGVRTIRLLKKDRSARQIFSPDKKHEKYLIPGDVHSVTLWLQPGGKIEATAIAVFDANNPNFKPVRHPAARKLVTLHKGDAIRTMHKGETKTVKVFSLVPSEGNEKIRCAPHNAARNEPEVQIRFGRFLLTQSRLVYVNAIGDVQDPGPIK
jgi:CRISPR-associated endonuclease Csn1